LPHWVAIRADQVAARHGEMLAFCGSLALTARHPTVRRKRALDRCYRVVPEEPEPRPIQDISGARAVVDHDIADGHRRMQQPLARNQLARVAA
jgi:hypothetical protein